MAEPDDQPPGIREDLTTPLSQEHPLSATPVPAFDFEPSRTFRDNELIAGRFRIRGFLGRGGMGEVYEAEDTELGGRVALKTIRGEIVAQPKVIERFRQEIQLARKVTHTNVCRVFDIFHHQSEHAAGKVTFLTMELLGGETLASRMRRQKRVPLDEALAIIEQMAAALDAAHRAGIVHRDFKSANVMLLPNSGEERALRVVVTDFGLARSLATSDSTATALTEEGVVGTPVYMAPEQFEGKPVTPAVDIYALGVVIYEMVTGELPFSGDSPFAVALKRLKEAPVSPRMHVPDLSPVWESTMLRCLEREPEDRFANGAEVVQALQGAIPAARRPSWKKSRRVIGLAAGVLLLIGLVVGSYFARKMNKPELARSSAGSLTPRRSVAVVGFKNLSGQADVAWLSTALAELLTTELGVGEKLRTVSGEDIARMKIETITPDADSFARETLARIRQDVGADLVLAGSYLALAGKIRLDVHLQDAHAGETIASVSDEGTQSQLFDLVSRVGARLRDKLQAGSVSPTQIAEVQNALPSNQTATRLYSEGLAKLRIFEALGAKELFEQSIAIDPNHALSHSALSAAWSALGDDGKAMAEAKKSFDLSTNLSREQRLSVEGRYREMTREWPRAIAIYQALFGFFPDNLEYGLRLASVQISSGKGGDALVTLQGLRRLPGTTGQDPRIDLVAASASSSLGDSKQALAAAQEAGRKADAQGAPLLRARAWAAEGDAWRNLGSPDKAAEAFRAANAIYAQAGDRGGVAGTLNSQAILLYDGGDYNGAKKMYQESLERSRAIGSQGGVARALNNIALVLLSQGDVSGAKQYFRQALEIFRAMSYQRATALTLSNLAHIYRNEAQFGPAQKALEESLDISREIGDQRGVALASNNLGIVLTDEGSLDRAKTKYEESLAICHTIGNKALTDRALHGLGEVLLEQGDLAGARKRHEEALAIQRELKEKAAIAESLVALAQLSIEEGNFQQAEGQARDAAEQSRLQKETDLEGFAEAVLAISLLQQGKLADGQKAADRALALSKASHDLDLRLFARITAARVQGAGKSSEAVKSLRALSAEAAKDGFVARQFDARLALVESEIASNDPMGQEDLAALEKDATSRGFVLVARKAAAAGSGHQGARNLARASHPAFQ